MAKLLLEKGANVNLKDVKYYKIAIRFSIKKIENKLRKLNTKKNSPLHLALKNNLKEIGKILISKGADVNAKNINSLNMNILF